MRSLIVAAALMLSAAGAARAQSGLNLSWDDCGSFGTSMKSFACDTNVGSNTMIASFAADSAYCLMGYLAVLDLQTSESALPEWWQFKNSGACRQSALSASVDFAAGPTSCQDPWTEGGGAPVGVLSYEVGFGAPNRARTEVLASLLTECLPTPAGAEVYAFKLIVSNEKSVGSGSCGGCQDAGCIVFNSLRLDQYSGFPRPVLSTALSRNYVTWQAGIPDCPGATPSRNHTWGAVKMLYR